MPPRIYGQTKVPQDTSLRIYGQPQVQKTYNIDSPTEKVSTMSPDYFGIAPYEFDEMYSKPLDKETKERIRKFGAISKEPWQPWWGHVADFAKELVPFRYKMSKQGRQWFDALPEPAKGQKAFLEFTKAVDILTILLTPVKLEAKIARGILAKRSITKLTKPNKAIDDLLDNVIDQPLLRTKTLHGQQQKIKTVEQIADEVGLDTIITKAANDLDTQILSNAPDLTAHQVRQINIEQSKTAANTAANRLSKVGRPLLKPETGIVKSTIPAPLKTEVVPRPKQLDIPPRAPRKSSEQITDAINQVRDRAGLKPYTTKQILKDIDTVILKGEKGAFSIFDRKPTQQQLEASERLLEGMEIVKRKAQRAGVDTLQYLRDSGVDDGTMRLVAKELVDVETIAKATKFSRLGNPEVLNEATQDVTQETIENQVTLGRVYSKPITEKDIGWWGQRITPPHWVVQKYPRLKSLYGFARKGEDLKMEISTELHKSIESFYLLKGKDYKLVKRLLTAGDELSEDYTTKQLLEQGASEKAIEAYRSVRNSLNEMNKDYWKTVREFGYTDDEIRQLKQQRGDITGYFPRMRKGKFFIKATKEGEAPIRTHYNWGFQGNKVKKDLLSRGYKLTEEGLVSKLPEEVYFQISPESISAVFEAAAKDWDTLAKDELKDKIIDVMKQRGFSKHGISRQDLVKGFETDNLKNVMFDYINGYAGFKSKLQMGKNFSNELVELAFGKTAREAPGQFAFAQKYVRDIMAPSEAADRVSGAIRQAAFFKYLGGIFKSGVVNLTQNFVAAAPRLSLETRFAGSKITKAMGDIVGHYSGRKLVQDEAAALRTALQKGWGQDMYMRELQGHLARYGSIPRRIQNAAGFFMSTAEKFNRQSTFLASYRVFKDKAIKKGLQGEEALEWAIKKAGRIVEDSHFVYGRTNLPGIFRGSTTKKLARAGYTFRTFTHNYINLLDAMAKKPGGKTAVARSIATIGAIGGVSSIPLFKTAESISMRFGYNARSEIKKKADEYGLGDKSNLLLYGAPALMDIDLGGSIGIEMPGQQELTRENLFEAGLETAVDILGVPASFVEDTWQSAEQLHYGDYYRAVEESPVTPQLVSQGMKAYRESKEGKTTRTGRPIFKEGTLDEKVKPTLQQAIQKGVFGFQTVESTEDFRKHRGRRVEVQRWERKAKQLKVELRKALNKHGFMSPKVDKIMDSIFDYNDTKPEYASEIQAIDVINDMQSRGFSLRDELLLEKIK